MYIYILGFQLFSQKYFKRWLNICALFLVYSQIWLNIPRDGFHFFAASSYGWSPHWLWTDKKKTQTRSKSWWRALVTKTCRMQKCDTSWCGSFMMDHDHHLCLLNHPPTLYVHILSYPTTFGSFDTNYIIFKRKKIWKNNSSNYKYFWRKIWNLKQYSHCQNEKSIP